MNKGKKVDILFGNDSGAWNLNGNYEIQEKFAFSFLLPSLFFSKTSMSGGGRSYQTPEMSVKEYLWSQTTGS